LAARAGGRQQLGDPILVEQGGVNGGPIGIRERCECYLVPLDSLPQSVFAL
jgi:hypothetical protein